MIYYETDYLAHHGILGMKWGVRRYQNKDGSLTSEGRRRQAMDKKSSELKKRAEKEAIQNPAAKELRKMYDDWRKKNPKADEDDYGDYIVSDPKLEAKYDKLLEQANMSSHTKKARELMSDSSKIRSKYVSEQTAGTAIVSACLAGPIAAFTVNKVMKISGADGKKRAIASLATGLGVTAVSTLHAYAKSKQDHEKTVNKYKLDKERFNLSEQREAIKSKINTKPTLTTRFDKAKEKYPSLTYEKIYKEMKVDMSSEDQDDYKKAEDEWLKKHGF